jgi:hypothetical protein
MGVSEKGPISITNIGEIIDVELRGTLFSDKPTCMHGILCVYNIPTLLHTHYMIHIIYLCSFTCMQICIFISVITMNICVIMCEGHDGPWIWWNSLKQPSFSVLRMAFLTRAFGLSKPPRKLWFLPWKTGCPTGSVSKSDPGQGYPSVHIKCWTIIQRISFHIVSHCHLQASTTLHDMSWGANVSTIGFAVERSRALWFY